MAETKNPNLAISSWTMVDHLLAMGLRAYKASASERGHLHDAAFGGNPVEEAFASEVLDLIEIPVDDLAGIASHKGRGSKIQIHEQILLLEDSPLAKSMSVSRLLSKLQERGDDQLMLVIERADHLRLVLKNLLQTQLAEISKHEAAAS